MIFNLTDLSGESLQSQIAGQLRAGILSGELAAGTILPSIRGLARDQKVSVVTVQRGYENLERDGLIHSRRGKGFFVSPMQARTRKKLAKEGLMDKMEPLLKKSLEEGMSPDEIREAIEKILKKQTGDQHG
ncbi:MAG: GntR family transcriptional regulator [bacterium]|nr:GntR family transcriptional regulator [bacterium]